MSSSERPVADIENPGAGKKRRITSSADTGGSGGSDRPSTMTPPPPPGSRTPTPERISRPAFTTLTPVQSRKKPEERIGLPPLPPKRPAVVPSPAAAPSAAPAPSRKRAAPSRAPSPSAPTAAPSPSPSPSAPSSPAMEGLPSKRSSDRAGAGAGAGAGSGSGSGSGSAFGSGAGAGTVPKPRLEEPSPSTKLVAEVLSFMPQTQHNNAHRVLSPALLAQASGAAARPATAAPAPSTPVQPAGCGSGGSSDGSTPRSAGRRASPPRLDVHGNALPRFAVVDRAQVRGRRRMFPVRVVRVSRRVTVCAVPGELVAARRRRSNIIASTRPFG